MKDKNPKSYEVFIDYSKHVDSQGSQSQKKKIIHLHQMHISKNHSKDDQALESYKNRDYKLKIEGNTYMNWIKIKYKQNPSKSTQSQQWMV